MSATIRPADRRCQTPSVNGSGKSSQSVGSGWPRATMGDMAKVDRAVFRLPVVALLIPVVLAVFATPLATVGGGWIWLYLLPVLALIYVLITRTVADPTGVRTSGITGLHRLAWAEMDGLEFSGSRWAVAVAHDGRRLRLPMVRPRDLPRLAAVSGGSLWLDPPAEPTSTPSAEPITHSADQPAEPSPDQPTEPGAGATLDAPQAPSSSASEGSRPGQPAE
jgi:hypothetical protein